MEERLPSWCWDDGAARRKLESIVWPKGPVCPYCGETSRFYKLQGARYRAGLLKCGACRRHFTVMIGTPFHHTHLPLRKWFLALHLLYLNGPAPSTRALQHALGVDYKTAASLVRRFRSYDLTGLRRFEDLVRVICAVPKRE